MSTTGITYSGRVVLTRYKNGKKIGTRVMHNNGTFTLFRYLCKCLSRTNTVNENEKPFSVDLCYYNNNDDGKLVSLLVSGNKPIWSDSTVQYLAENNSNSCFVEYTFYLASGNINSASVNGGIPEGTKLVYVLRDRNDTSDTNDGEVLATVVDDSFDAKTLHISTNEVWVIKWRMTLQDAQGE